MQPVDDAYIFEAVRYLEAYQAEERQNLHKSVPGPLVAELFWYIESSLDGVKQEDLECRLLAVVKKGLRDKESASEWRAYAPNPGRNSDEISVWRRWRHGHGKKKGIRASLI